MADSNEPRHPRLTRRGIRLEYTTLAWMIVATPGLSAAILLGALLNQPAGICWTDIAIAARSSWTEADPIVA